jgi:hypothetical protein
VLLVWVVVGAAAVWLFLFADTLVDAIVERRARRAARVRGFDEANEYRVARERIRAAMDNGRTKL